jgi:hypothetical protein
MATNPPKKLVVVVIGATGNQGGSVARRFLRDPRCSVRALTRNPASPAALALSALGAEVVPADLDDPASLRAAFAGANAIFSVTQYWEPFFRPDCRAAAAELGVSCRRYAYDVEVRQGRNIADAAAGVVEGLEENGFWVSTLSSARECSGGRMTEVYHFDGKADVFPRYVEEKWPELAKKTSCVHTGYFMTSWGILPGSYLNKVGRPSVGAGGGADFGGSKRMGRTRCGSHAPGQGGAASRCECGHGKLCVCGFADAAGQGVHVRGHVCWIS